MIDVIGGIEKFKAIWGRFLHMNFLFHMTG